MKKKKDYSRLLLLLLSVFIMASCSSGGGEKASDKTDKAAVVDPNDPMQNKGIGPVKKVKLGQLDTKMAEEGKAIYDLKCASCHKPTEKFVGPAPKGILERRSPEWIMNMILNPEEMIKNDPIAKQLLIESNLAPMANQNITEDEARKILEYFRTID